MGNPNVTITKKLSNSRVAALPLQQPLKKLFDVLVLAQNKIRSITYLWQRFIQGEARGMRSVLTSSTKMHVAHTRGNFRHGNLTSRALLLRVFFLPILRRMGIRGVRLGEQHARELYCRKKKVHLPGAFLRATH